MDNKYILFVLLFLLILPQYTRAGMFGPSNYDECITESMKGVKSDIAALAIIKSLKSVFSKDLEIKEVVRFNADQLILLNGIAKYYEKCGKFFGCKVYNGNENIAVISFGV